MEKVKRGIYRHFKGGEYPVTGTAEYEETLEIYVVYQALYGDYSTKIRRLDVFIEDIDVPEYNYKGPRFRLIKELE